MACNGNPGNTSTLYSPMIKIYSLFVLPNMNIIWIKQVEMKPLILKYLWRSPKKDRGERAVCPEPMLFITYNKNMNISNTAAAITDLKSSNILYFTNLFFFFFKNNILCFFPIWKWICWTLQFVVAEVKGFCLLKAWSITKTKHMNVLHHIGKHVTYG